MLIVTKYYGPTNTLGSRIGARWIDGGGRKITFIPYQNYLNSEENHIRALHVLCNKMKVIPGQFFGVRLKGQIYWVRRNTALEIYYT